MRAAGKKIHQKLNVYQKIILVTISEIVTSRYMEIPAMYNLFAIFLSFNVRILVINYGWVEWINCLYQSMS